MFGDAPDVFYHRGGVLKHTPVNPLMGVPYLRTRLVPDRKVGAVNMSAAERLERDSIAVDGKPFKNFRLGKSVCCVGAIHAASIAHLSVLL